MSTVVESPGDQADQAVPDQARLRWWRELAYVLVFYLVYSWVRNQFGSAAVAPRDAFINATRVIRLEQMLGLYAEPTIQRWFLGWGGFIRFWNVFYGTFHFVVTGFTMIWLYRRFPRAYPRWRNSLAFTTTFGLVGFALFPLMPPRLLGNLGPLGGRSYNHHFVDTLVEYGGVWSFHSTTMEAISNQYAAMPSLHLGWSIWCYFALDRYVRRRFTRALITIYPFLTMFAVIVTANHYWLDAVGGGVVFGLGAIAGTRWADLVERFGSSGSPERIRVTASSR